MKVYVVVSAIDDPSGPIAYVRGVYGSQAAALAECERLNKKYPKIEHSICAMMFPRLANLLGRFSDA